MRAIQPFSQGELWGRWGELLGRWSVMRRAEDAILAGMLISFRRMVAVVALASPVPAIVAAARVRLNSMTANTSQAAFAVNALEGRRQGAAFQVGVDLLDDRVAATSAFEIHRFVFWS